MKSLFLQALLVALGIVSACAEPAHLMPKVPVLPLALDDSIQFRKTIIFIADPTLWKSNQEEMINFERLRVFYGAVTAYERQQRFGDYYQFFWRSTRPVDHLIVRFEYRQEKLGAFVQAQERSYRSIPKGVIESKFSVIGDDYTDDGKVTAWRAIIIEDGKIVALNQSYLWR